MSLKVLKCNSPVSLQDLGRKHSQHLGISQSGAADEHAFRWSNKLLENPSTCAGLEILLGYFSAKFLHAVDFCITGAEAPCFLNGKKIRQWQTYRANSEDTIEIKQAHSGLYIYLGIKAGFHESVYFGSQSFNPREAMVTPKLKYIQKFDEIPYTPAATNLKFKTKFLDEQYIPDYNEPLALSFIPQPFIPQPFIPQHNFENFASGTRDILYSTHYQISNESNRMASKLSGEKIVFEGPVTASKGVCLGTVQIPDNGQPIILLKDRQTIGGYPVIGKVTSLDCFKLAQRRPGEKISFKATTIEREEKKLKKFLAFFN